MKFLTGSFIGTGGHQGSLFWAFKWRTSWGASDLDHSLFFTPLDFLLRCSNYMLVMYTPVILFLIGIWIMGLIVKFLKREDIEKDLFLISLFLVGIIHVVLFKQGAWTHEYWFVYLLPGFVISAALTFEQIINKLPKISIAIITLLLTIFGAFSIHTVLLRHKECYNERTLYFYQLGLLIRDNTEITDKIFFAGISQITEYYANRNMIMGINTAEKLEKMIKAHPDYNYFVIHKNLVDRTLLAKYYNYIIKGDYAFIKLP